MGGKWLKSVAGNNLINSNKPKSDIFICASKPNILKWGVGFVEFIKYKGEEISTNTF